MGLLSDAERAEFEANCIAHPEVAAARNAFETALEAQLLGDAVAPPAYLKERVLEQLTVTPTIATNEAAEEDHKVRSFNPWKWVAAASLLLTAAAGYWAYRQQAEKETLLSQNRTLQEQLQTAQATTSPTEETPQLLGDKDVKTAAFLSAEDKLFATVYWDTTSQDVYLMVNNMPQPAPDKAYQLWAILKDNPAPVDLGLIKASQEKLLIKMKNVQNAAAFAITLEPAGGSAAPTTTPLVAKGL